MRGNEDTEGDDEEDDDDDDNDAEDEEAMNESLPVKLSRFCFPIAPPSVRRTRTGTFNDSNEGDKEGETGEEEGEEEGEVEEADDGTSSWVRV